MMPVEEWEAYGWDEDEEQFIADGPDDPDNWIDESEED